MGENDVSSDAAQGARAEDDNSEGLLSRWWRAFGNAADEDDDVAGSRPELRSRGSVHGLANLTRLRVEDVMIPRVEVAAAPLDIGRDELIELFRQSGLTRLPVYRDTLDSPLGLVHLKDFALRYGFNGGQKATFDLDGILRPTGSTWPS